MASSASAPSLDRPGVERLLALLQPEHSLPLFPLPAETEDASDWRCSAFLLRTRAGGFVAAVPDTETVAEHLTTWWMRKVRRWLWFGRPTWPWRLRGGACLARAQLFWWRVRVTSGPAATTFQVDGNTARPVRQSATEAADA